MAAEAPDDVTPCREELVYARTADGLLLEGLLLRPAGGTGIEPAGAPVLILVHGKNVSFTLRNYVRIGRAAAARGLPFISANTRGHDLGNKLLDAEDALRRRGFGGACWERLADSPLDVAAWIDLAVQTAPGAPGVALFGHSYGATKVVFYQAERRDPRVLGVGIGSSELRGPRASPALAASVAAAEQLVAAGRGSELLPREGGPNLVSADALLNELQTAPAIFGGDGGEPALAKLACPVLAVYGSDAQDPHGSAATLRERAPRAARVDTHVLDGADHIYEGYEAQLGALLVQWARSLQPLPTRA